jgi:uncharacterized protein (DUF1501 family)
MARRDLSSRGSPTRRSLLGSLGAVAAVGTAGVVGLAGAEPAPVRLVLAVANGGWDPTFTVDPKPGWTSGGPYPDLDPRDAEDVEEIVAYGQIDVSSNRVRRPAVDRYFDAHLARTAVVNGLWVPSLSHWDAMVHVLTGTGSYHAPDIGVLAGVGGASLDRLAAIDLSGLGRFGDHAPRCMRVGERDQLAELLGPGERWSPSGSDQAAIDAYLAGRALEEGDVERLVALGHLAALRSRADVVAGALPSGRRTAFADNVPVVLSLLAEDLCRAVIVSTGPSWDTHARGSFQHGHWDKTFAGLHALLDGLTAAGMLETTLVVVVSELGRSPYRNRLGGTDHWTFTSAVLAGAGVAGGVRVGGTDGDLVAIGTDPETGRPSASAGPITTASFAAGVLDAVGVDPAGVFPGVAPLRAFRG